MDTLTKADEIAALKKMAKQPENSYLAGLFSKDLVEWAVWQISNDVIPDIFGFCQSKDRAWAEAADRATENASARREIQEEAERLGARVKDLLAALEIERQALASQREELATALDDLRTAHKVAADQEQKIIRLKAQLYDLLHPGS